MALVAAVGAADLGEAVLDPGVPFTRVKMRLVLGLGLAVPPVPLPLLLCLLDLRKGIDVVMD